MNKRKLLTLAMSLCVLAIVAVGGTLAYFTYETEEMVNTFTIGNVKIELLESQFHRVNAGKGDTTNLTVADEPINGGYLWAAGQTLEGTIDNTPDAENATWNGKYFSDDQIEDDAKTYKDKDGYFDTHATNMVPGSNVRKNPYIKNLSETNDAYVRLIAKIPANLFVVLDKGLSMWNTTALNAKDITSVAVDFYNNECGKDPEKFVELGSKFLKDGYYEFDFTYEKKLAPEEITFWNAWCNIAIDPLADEDDLKNIESFDVKFVAQAIQADNFKNGTEAFVAFDAKAAATNP